MAKPDRFIDPGSLGDLEWWRLRRVENFESVCLDFDVAGGKLRISRSLRTLPDEATHFENKLIADIIGRPVDFWRDLRIENDLRQSVPVAQIDEDQPTE